jgi:Fur family transcriptional regulator, ferric uptake regulator
MRRIAEPSTVLREAGLRPTSARLRVLSSLQTAGRSLSHRELVDLLFGIDRVTIFRSLKNLKKARLVHSVQGVDRTLRYFINPAEKRGCPGGHPHFLCLRCRGMSCLTDQQIAVVRVPPGAEVRGKQLLVYGICTSCASKRARTAPRYGSARVRARPEGRTRSAGTPYTADSAPRPYRGATK